MTTRAAHCHGNAFGHFGQGVLRPPVPGEENVKSDTVRPESYKPEGRATSDHAHPSWAESLQAVLDDQDGISLFRDFLTQDGWTDLIDFWLACRGFQLAFRAPESCSSTSPNVLKKRRLKLAKAIYRKYIISGGVVAKKIRAVTKSSLGERVQQVELDSALFLQAKQEVQDAMEAEVYPLFLKSHVFLTNAQETCTEKETQTWEVNTHKQETGNDQQEVNSSIQEPERGKKELKQKTKNNKQEVPRVIPELVEKSEWVESETASANLKRPEHCDAGYKPKHRLVQGCVKANAHKTSHHNKDHVHHIPKDVHTEPHKFAADLINRLELVQRERDNWRQVEENLHPVSTQQENDDTEVSTASTLCSHFAPTHHGSSHSAVQWCDAQAENPDLILDQHAQSKTEAPSWSSPTTHILSHTCCKSLDTWLYGDMAGTNKSAPLRYSSRRKCVCESVTVAYYFCGEPIPYLSTVRGRVVTLAHFTQLLTRKGAYRFFFKKASDEFDCGVVYEEVCEDAAVLPMFQGKIIGKVEKIC